MWWWKNQLTMLAKRNSPESSTAIFNCDISRFVLRSAASIDPDRVFLFRFVACCRGSTRKSCFSRLRETCRKTRCEISDNRCSLDAIDEWIHRTAHSARPGSISLFPDFRLFFPGLPQRYFVTPIVRWGDDPAGSVRGFCFPRILKYRDYTIRRSNLIENEGATLIYGLPTLV